MTKKKKTNIFKKIILTLTACFIAVFSVFSLVDIPKETKQVSASEIISGSTFNIKNPYLAFNLQLVDNSYFDNDSSHPYVFLFPFIEITNSSNSTIIEFYFRYFNVNGFYNCIDSYNAPARIDDFPVYSELDNTLSTSVSSSGAYVKIFNGSSLYASSFLNSATGSAFFDAVGFSISTAGGTISITVPNNGYGFEFNYWLTCENTSTDANRFSMCIPVSFYYSGSTSSIDFTTYHRESQLLSFSGSNFGSLFYYNPYFGLGYEQEDTFYFNNQYLHILTPRASSAVGTFFESDYYITSPDDAYQNGYDAGYDAGEDTGYDNGYDTGYDAGVDAGYQDGYDEGVRVNTNSSYAQGYDDGQTNGYSTGFVEGENSGLEKGYNNGFTVGKNEGYQLGLESSDRYNFTSLVSAVVDVPINTFTSLFNFELLGVNLSGFFLGLLTLCIIITIVKMIL